MYGLYSTAACNQERPMMARVRYLIISVSDFADCSELLQKFRMGFRQEKQLALSNIMNVSRSILYSLKKLVAEVSFFLL